MRAILHIGYCYTSTWLCLTDLLDWSGSTLKPTLALTRALLGFAPLFTGAPAFTDQHGMTPCSTLTSPHRSLLIITSHYLSLHDPREPQLPCSHRFFIICPDFAFCPGLKLSQTVSNCLKSKINAEKDLGGNRSLWLPGF